MKYAILPILTMVTALGHMQSGGSGWPFLKAIRSLDYAAIRKEAESTSTSQSTPNKLGIFHTLAVAFPDGPNRQGKLPTDRQAADLVKVLLEVKGNPNALNSATETPLHVAARYNTCASVIKAMIAGGANPNVRQSAGPWHTKTPLIVAIEADLEIAARALVENGADLEMRGGYGNPFPLQIAAWRGSLKFVKLLVNHGAKVNAAKEDGQTALWAAALVNKPENAEVIKYLLSKGADRDAEKDGETALQMAQRKKFGPIVKALRG